LQPSDAVQPVAQIVCLLGAAHSGKSTVAHHLVQTHGFTRLRFAEPLKDMLMTMGLTRDQVDGPPEIKNAPCALLLGKTPRLAMQTLGTEWRDMIDKRLWASIVRSRVHALLEAGVTKIVIDDMRFLHEAEMFAEFGSVIVAVRRPEVEPNKLSRAFGLLHLPRFLRGLAHLLFNIQPIHRSEAEWYKIEPHHQLWNDKSVADLLALVDLYVTPRN
jgi:hypothetical protein